ncbi:hypothetical protein [Bradyrhizobium barranii]
MALELSKTSWVCAFAVPGDNKATAHKIKARDVDRLISILNSSETKAEHQLSRPLRIVLCYEVGYDGFWLARLLMARGIRTVVFDPASFLMPRRGRRAKTDRLDAEGMTRTLRTWLSGDREVARDVLIPSVWSKKTQSASSASESTSSKSAPASSGASKGCWRCTGFGSTANALARGCWNVST